MSHHEKAALAAAVLAHTRIAPSAIHVSFDHHADALAILALMPGGGARTFLAKGVADLAHVDAAALVDAELVDWRPASPATRFLELVEA